ncbi:MAG: hypothetical protein J6C40_16000 [Lentisphaeria bacterium]|nr:hypothetical protein [Lentisphaeria bacterium]
MLKFNKKTLIIHGSILAVMLIACCVEFQMFLLWYLGYIIYFAGRLIAKCTKDLHSRGLKIFIIACMTAGLIPGIMIACIPAWVICVWYLESHPEIKEDLPVYNARGGVLLHDASLYRSYNNFLFEGNIEEKALKRAAVSQNWKFEEITRPVQVHYTAKTRIKSRRDNSEPAPVTVKEGLVFSSYNGSDCGAIVVYDRKTGRLYFSSTLR